MWWNGICFDPQVIGVQCPTASSLGEFIGYWDWLWYPWLPPVLVSIAFPEPFISRCFPFTLLHLPLNFNCVSSLPLMYLHPFDRPFTHSLVRWDSRLGTISGTRWYGSTRGGAGMRMKQKSRVKFLPWQYCVQCSTIWINLRKWHVHVHVYTWNLAKYIWDWEIEAKIWLRLGLRLVPRTPKSLKRICWQPTCYIVCLAKQSKCDAFLIMSCGVLFMMFTATL